MFIACREKEKGRMEEGFWVLSLNNNFRKVSCIQKGKLGRGERRGRGKDGEATAWF